MNHDPTGLPAGEYDLVSTGKVRAQEFFDPRTQTRMIIRVVRTADGKDIEVLCDATDSAWSQSRPSALNLPRCFARDPQPGPSGVWFRVTGFGFDLGAKPGEYAGRITVSNFPVTFDFQEGIAA